MKKLVIILAAGFLVGACDSEDQGSSRHSGANADREKALLQSPNNTERVESGNTTQSGQLTPDSVRTPATDAAEGRQSDKPSEASRY
jgi:hypothetical protein